MRSPSLPATAAPRSQQPAPAVRCGRPLAAQLPSISRSGRGAPESCDWSAHARATSGDEPAVRETARGVCTVPRRQSPVVSDRCCSGAHHRPRGICGMPLLPAATSPCLRATRSSLSGRTSRRKQACRKELTEHQREASRRPDRPCHRARTEIEEPHPGIPQGTGRPTCRFGLSSAVEGDGLLDRYRSFRRLAHLGHRRQRVHRSRERLRAHHAGSSTGRSWSRRSRSNFAQGFETGPQTPLAGEVAKMFCEMTGNERMTFCNTGSEAVLAALRVSRTVTGRSKVVMFSR